MARKAPEKVVSARDFYPRHPRSLPQLRRAASGCQGCELYLLGGQTVFGEGPRGAALMLIGEQPGDFEERVGRPFVGPAGRLVDQVLTQVGLDRAAVYVTNAVKHFRFVMRGKRRIHNSPKMIHIQSCRPWLEAEFAAIKPAVVLCLGAVAARAVLGPKVRVTRDRGRDFTDAAAAPHVLVTEHPAAILRGEPAERQARLAALVRDFQLARRISETAR